MKVEEHLFGSAQRQVTPPPRAGLCRRLPVSISRAQDGLSDAKAPSFEAGAQKATGALMAALTVGPVRPKSVSFLRANLPPCAAVKNCSSGGPGQRFGL
jgi:hypothetical protein